MDAVELFEHLNKHRPHVSEVLSQFPPTDDPHEIKRRLDDMERLFGEMWLLERQMVSSYSVGFNPFRKPKLSQVAMDQYIASLIAMREADLISQERLDKIVGPLKEVPSYRGPSKA